MSVSGGRRTMKGGPLVARLMSHIPPSLDQLLEREREGFEMLPNERPCDFMLHSNARRKNILGKG